MIRHFFASLAAMAAALSALALASLPAARAETEEIVQIPTRPGVTVRFILRGPRGGNPPVAILFAGGGGTIGLGSWNGKGNPSGNFLVRTRKHFASHGVLVAVPDAPSNLRHGDMSLWRTTKEHAADVAAVIRSLGRHSRGPVFLVGTSRGAISAAVTANLAPGSVAGVVLTATVTRYNRARSKNRVQDADLAAIRVPVLLAHHRDDACSVTPFEDISPLAEAFTGAPSVDVRAYSGGDGYRGSECGARTAHGFRGIEKRVVADIAAWMRRVATRKPLK